MADKGALGFLGFMFASTTAVVMLIAVVTVRAHMDGLDVLADAGDVATFSASR